MADITNQNIRVPGVNAAGTFVKQQSYVVDFATLSGIAGTGTHDIIKLDKGDAVVGVRVVALESAASSGAATLQLKLAFHGSAANINSSAVALAGLAKGVVQNMPVSGIKSFDSEYEGVIQLVVATAAYTAGKLLLIVDTVPAEAFVVNG
jgi:hypothetical protein